MRDSTEDQLAAVLVSAARLQEVVPGAVLVGGSAAAHHAGHRLSLDHDHVVADLAERFDTILEHLEALGDWSTARAQPGKLILGSLGGIESGIRQLRRTRPLEVEVIEVEGRSLRIPTPTETLRIKAWLAITRNQVRDYLDIAALADRVGIDAAAAALADLDAYYDDLYEGDDRVATQVVRQLGDPQPRDRSTIERLTDYKRLDERWQDWSTVVATTRAVARRMIEADS